MAETPSRQSLERAFERVPRLLRGVARLPKTAAALKKIGYTEAVHAEGWALLHAVAGFEAGARPALPTSPAAEAMASLDAWDERGFTLARAVLDWSHPEQAAFVFAGLKASTGAQAVVGIRLFLDRLTALEGGAERAATREADQAALADLASAGIDAAERARLAALVAQAEGVAPGPGAAASAAQAEADAAAERALVALHRWYGRWSTLARIAIHSKRDRITLGVSSPTRRATASEDAAEDADDVEGPLPA